MKLAFLNCGIESQLAIKYLVDKYNFKTLSITKLLKDIKEQYFKDIEQENFIYMLKCSLEKIDKYFLIKSILKKIDNETNTIITDIENSIEYYSVIMEDFIPIKIDNKIFNYDLELDSLPILKINSETDIDHFYEDIDVLIENYDILYKNRFKGGVIKYVEDDTK